MRAIDCCKPSEMTGVPFVEIEGFRCYSPDVALDCADYPSEGFDVTAEVEAGSFWYRARKRILRRVIERFTDRSRPLDMLEIGCGIGSVIGALRSVPDLRLTGSEISLHALRYARSRFPDVDFIQLDAARIPFRMQFDIVGAFDVLEHIEGDEQVIRAAYDALRPGGFFIATVPQFQWMWSSLDSIVGHKRRYAKSELLRKVRHSHFNVVSCSSFVTALFPAMFALRLQGRIRSTQTRAKETLASHVTLSPALNRVCDWVMRVDELALACGCSLPFGGSLLVVGQKPHP